MENNAIKLLFNATETLKDTLKLAVNDGVVLASEEKRESRIDICSKCKCLDKSSTRCSLCGCFMNWKVRLEASKCPAAKW